jgi:hypothetical protein
VEKLDPVTKLPILDEHGQPIMVQLSPMSNLQMRFKIVNVFDVAQTSGEPLPELIQPIDGDVERYELFMDALRDVSPLPIAFENLPEGADGKCHFGDRIAIRSGMSQVQTVSAVVHEITHAKLHDRKLNPGFEQKDHRTVEVEAESTAFTTLAAFGVDTGKNSFPYVLEWSKSKELKELNASLDTIRKTAAELIDGIDKAYRELAKQRGIDLTAKAEKTADEPETPDINEPLREEAQNAVDGMKSVEEISAKTAENRLFDKLSELFPDFMSGKYSYLKLESPGMEPLSLEWIGKCFSMMHTYTLNGDLCYDPDIVFEVDRGAHTLSAVQFQQSIPPLYQERQDSGEWLSVDGNGNQKTINGLEKPLNEFAKQWLANISEQGYMPVRANLEIDGEETQITFTKDGDPILPDDGEPPEAQYELGYGFLGNGITVWNKAEMNAENDYRTVAHINTDRTVDFYDKDMPDDVKAKIIKTAESPDTWAFGFDSAPERETVQRKETTLDLSLPDPNWTVAEMFEYGYKREDMFPLSVGRAVELFDAGHTIYLLYDDNTEAVAFDRDEIITFSSDGFCGITKTDWEMSPVRDAQNKVYENVIPNREQIENSRESESKSVSISDLSKKPGIVEKLNAINNALKKSPDAPERVPVNDRGESR